MIRWKIPNEIGKYYTNIQITKNNLIWYKLRFIYYLIYHQNNLKKLKIHKSTLKQSSMNSLKVKRFQTRDKLNIICNICIKSRREFPDEMINSFIMLLNGRERTLKLYALTWCSMIFCYAFNYNRQKNRK